MNDFTMNGRCTCGSIRYRLTSRPLIVHACHCRWCQRETGMSFAQTAIVLFCYEGSPEVVWTASNSGLRILGFDKPKSHSDSSTRGHRFELSPPRLVVGDRESDIYSCFAGRSAGSTSFSAGARPCNRARTGSAGCRGVAVRQRGGLA